MGRRPPLVAITTWSRGLPFSAFASRLSEAPKPYACAVSKKLIPLSAARPIAATAASSSVAPQSPPSCQVPNATGDTPSSLRPNLMFFIAILLNYGRTVSYRIIQNVVAATAIPTKEKRGRPRSGQTNKAILKAAAEIVMGSGLAEMTIEGVAERAGVGKASIYPRWASQRALAFDAVVDTILATQPTPDTRSLEGDLARVAESWVRLSNARRGGRTVAHFIAEVQSDPDLAVVWRGRVVDRVRRGRRAVLDRAVGRGGIPGGRGTALVMGLLYGAPYHPDLQRHLPVHGTFPKGVARMVAAAAKDGAAL